MFQASLDLFLVTFSIPHPTRLIYKLCTWLWSSVVKEISTEWDFLAH